MNPTSVVLASWRHDWEDKGSPWHYCADHWIMLHGTTPACTECGGEVANASQTDPENPSTQAD